MFIKFTEPDGMDNALSISKAQAPLPRVFVTESLSDSSLFAQIARQLPARLMFDEADMVEERLPARSSAQSSPEYIEFMDVAHYLVDNNEFESVENAVRACYVAFDVVEGQCAPALSSIELSVLEGTGHTPIYFLNGDIEVSGATLKSDGLWHAKDSTHWYMTDAIRAAGEKIPESTYPPELH